MADGKKSIATNKKAFHDYFVVEQIEAGIQLFGTEIKSIRNGGVNLKDSWCEIIEGEIFVNGMHIAPYEKGNVFNRDSYRPRKLLMHKREIMRLFGIVKQQGLTLVPIELYYKGSRAKLAVGVCKGKKLYDKRADLAAKAVKRDNERYFKERNS